MSNEALTPAANVGCGWFRTTEGDVLLIIYGEPERPDSERPERMRVLTRKADWPMIVAAVGSKALPDQVRVQLATTMHVGRLQTQEQLQQMLPGGAMSMTTPPSTTGQPSAPEMIVGVCEPCAKDQRIGESHPACSTKGCRCTRCVKPAEKPMGAALANGRAYTIENKDYELTEEQFQKPPTCGAEQLRIDGPTDVCTFDPLHDGRHSFDLAPPPVVEVHQ